MKHQMKDLTYGYTKLNTINNYIILFGSNKNT